jgi:eight-cysteine-cluster-containing protein
MEKPIRLIPLIFIPLILTISGCISGLDAESLAKASPVIQDFLEDHPNADILATHFTANQSGMMLEEIREECANPFLEAKEYYRVRFTDDDTGFYAVVWIDWDSRKVECAYKKGGGSDTPEECKPHHVAKCYGQHVYWFDSCDYKEEKREYCEKGCQDGRCIDKNTCEGAGGYCVYQKESDSTTGSTGASSTAAGAIIGMVHDTDVSTAYSAGTSECIKYYVCPDGTKIQFCEEVKKYNDQGVIIGVACGCKEKPSNECPVSSSTSGGGGIAYPKCSPDHRRADFWCPDNGVCCIPENKCEDHYKSKCYGSHVYWYDSCGNLEDKKEYCENGCENGHCKEKPKEFCGTSTHGPCQTNEDCMTSGCSGQICQSTSEDALASDCMWTDCYDDEKYGVACTCYEGSCKWKKAECSDSDDGKSYYTKGETYGMSQSGQGPEIKNWVDYCANDNDLIEFSCRSLTHSDSDPLSVWSDYYICEHGCENGRCIVELEQICSDSDGGKNYYEKGTVSGSGSVFSDHCNNDGTLTEKFCTDSWEISAETVECPGEYVCDGGRCVMENTCDDSDAGNDYYVRGLTCDNHEGHRVILTLEEGEKKEVGASETYGAIKLNSIDSSDSMSITVYNPGGGTIKNVSIGDMGSYVSFIYHIISLDNGVLTVYAYPDKYYSDYGCFVDKCSGNYIEEGYCEDDVAKKTSMYNCLDGCENGACVNCAGEGEQFSHVFTNDYPEQCCEGLTEWSVWMDNTISIGSECYETGLFLATIPVGTCINCGNQICEDDENPCNCPDDCGVSGENSDYTDNTAFCQESPESIITACNETVENLTLCTLCQW